MSVSTFDITRHLSGDDEHGHEEKPWGDVIGASLLVNIISLIGVVFVAISYMKAKDLCAVNEDGSFKNRFLRIVTPSFACGALIATTVFLIIPEALAHIAVDSKMHHEEHEEHGEEEEEEGEPHTEADQGRTSWIFGTALMGGFLLPFIFGALFHLDNKIFKQEAGKSETTDATTMKKAQDDEENATEENITDEESAAEISAEALVKVRKNQLLASILLGDAVHNFVDGVFIGVAFKGCTKTLAWTITASTIYHELAQELADYFLLTNQCGLKPVIALLLNFVSGLSGVLGAIIMMATDPSDTAIGVLLAISGGVYLQIAACECASRVHLESICLKDKLYGICGFIIGAIPIGLVLLKHEHCDDHNH